MRRRACVAHVTAKLDVSERFACKVLGQHRSTQRKAPETADDEAALTAAIIDWARQYGRYGYRRVTALLRAEGWSCNHKRVERIWRREGLKVPLRQPKRGRLWLNDGSCVRLRPERANHVWAYDFVEDRTRDGRKLRMLNVVDEFTRECLCIRVGRKLGAADVIDVLSDLFIARGTPGFVRSDNGPEFIALAVKGWITGVSAKTAYIEPGSPWENGSLSGISCEGSYTALRGLEDAMVIRQELVEELLAGRDPSEVFTRDGLLDELKRALAERMLDAELDQHLASERARVDEGADGEADGPRNHRNGHSRKTVLKGTGKLDLQVPRDRLSSFEPQLIAKYRRRFPEFDDKVVSLYARGMTVREIQGHLRELYGIDVSPDLVSTVTDAVLEQVAEWQNRPLDTVYALVFFDALRVKIRDEGTVRNKAVYIALGVRPDGTKEVLGLWIEQTEGAKFWLRVMNDLRHRGVADILIAVVDGLRGFPEAITAVFPDTQVQTCVVHLIRHSMAFVSWKDRREVVAALKPVYRAANADLALAALDAFADGPWGTRYPAIAPAWRRQWEQVTPFYAYPVEVRRMIYTTNAIESLNSTLRKAVRLRGHFPTDEAATKLLFLALREVSQGWKMPPREWNIAKTQFAVMFGDRFTAS